MASKAEKDQQKEAKKASKNRGRGSSGLLRRFGILRKLRKLIGLAVVIFLIIFLLAGGVNQVKTGQSIADFAVGKGKEIASFFEGLVKGDSPLKITEDGIYFKDSNPPGETSVEKETLEEIDEKAKDAANKVIEKGKSLSDD